MAARDAARSLQGVEEEVRRRRHRDLRLQLQHRTPASPTPRSIAASRWRRRSAPTIITASTHDDRGQAHRAARREAQDGRGHARPLEHQRSERVRDARELRRGDEDVEVLQGQPRHRPLHRRQLRRGGLHPRAPRRHHEPAPEGPQEEPGRQRAVGRGRHADPRGAAAAQEGGSGRSPPTSNTSTGARARRSRK